MLRESSRVEEEKVDLSVLTQGHKAGTKLEGGLPAQAELVHFAEVALGDDDELIAAARDQLDAVVGPAAMIDAAAVIANFQRMVRIADGTGIPLDDPVAMTTTLERSELGIDDFSSAANTPELGIFQQILGRMLRPFLSIIFKRMAGK